MVIEINGLPHPQAKSANDNKQVDVARGESSHAQDETGAPSTADTVSLTDTASRLRSLENTLANLPVADPQRVESFRDAILKGNYSVNADRVAEKLLSFDEQLG